MRDYDAPIHIPVEFDVDTSGIRAQVERLAPAAGHLDHVGEDMAAAMIEAVPRIREAWAADFNAGVDVALEELLRLDRERREHGSDDGA